MDEVKKNDPYAVLRIAEFRNFQVSRFSMTFGIQLAETIFQAPVALGHTGSLSGLKSALDQPEFLTAIGLVKYGSMRSPKPAPAGFLPNLKTMFNRFLPQR